MDCESDNNDEKTVEFRQFTSGMANEKNDIFHNLFRRYEYHPTQAIDAIPKSPN